MLAVVFWNSRSDASDDRTYEAALIDFHRELNRHRPSGLRRSLTLTVTKRLPWLDSVFRVYEDWYLVSNFGALDAMDKLILKDGSLQSHRTLMTSTGAAIGAVLYLRQGCLAVERSAYAYWVTNLPQPSTVEATGTALLHDTVRADSVWTRVMGLGPAGHCLLSNNELALPSQARAVALERTVLWAS